MQGQGAQELRLEVPVVSRARLVPWEGHERFPEEEMLRRARSFREEFSRRRSVRQ